MDVHEDYSVRNHKIWLCTKIIQCTTIKYGCARRLFSAQPYNMVVHEDYLVDSHKIWFCMKIIQCKAIKYGCTQILFSGQPYHMVVHKDYSVHSHKIWFCTKIILCITQETGAQGPLGDSEQDPQAVQYCKLQQRYCRLHYMHGYHVLQ